MRMRLTRLKNVIIARIHKPDSDNNTSKIKFMKAEEEKLDGVNSSYYEV